MFWNSKKQVIAHRVSYEIYIGEIPKELCVLHTCDQPSCVNPNHLFLGTHQENMTDKKNKGRVFKKKPEENNTTKLTWDLVNKIRETSGTHRELGKLFGVSHTNIGYIKRNKIWKREEGKVWDYTHLLTGENQSDSEAAEPSGSTTPKEEETNQYLGLTTPDKDGYLVHGH